MSALVLGSIAIEMTGSGKSSDSSSTGRVHRRERVAGDDVAQADHRGDVAGEDLVELLALVGVHLQQPADAALAALGDVQHRVARLGAPE